MFLHKFHHLLSPYKSYMKILLTMTLPLWQSSDVTLMQVLLGKGSTRCGNCDSTPLSIISHYGLAIFVHRNCIL